jgi:hypothetical protein
MPEMILPGTYIEVRAEGLMLPGPISVGNLGIVGTASRGRLADPNDPTTVYLLTDAGTAREIFGPSDSYLSPEDGTTPLTLVRAIELAFGSGAQRVFAVRVAASGASPATYTLSADSGSVTVRALAPGSSYNGSTITTGDYSLTLTILSGTGNARGLESIDHLPLDPDEFVTQVSARSRLFTASNQGGDAPIDLGAAVSRTTDGDPTTAAEFGIPAGSGTVRLTAVNPGSDPNAWSIGVAGAFDVSLQVGRTTETFRDAPTVAPALQRVLAGTDSNYDFRTKSSTGAGSSLFALDPGAVTGNVGANQTAQPSATGSSGADAGIDRYQIGLDTLLNQDVQIVVLAGQGGRQASSALAGHVESASSDLIKRERIGVIGSDPSATLANLVAPAEDEGRLLFVGPGIQTTDTATGLDVTLPGTYAAAAVAGLISSLDPQASPTNKTVNVTGVQTRFNGGELEQLVLGRVLALEDRNGSIRVVRGITSSTNTAWSQITTRRIVDFARNGVREAANPFIGKLNNARVRQALKGSINSILADMVDREMLISYSLDVTATRDEQIRGIVEVTMVLQPTFSIDYIRVVMYLQ